MGEKPNQEILNNNNVPEANDDEQDWPSAKRRRSDDPKESEGASLVGPPLPPWFHPPMALPAVAKEEILEPWLPDRSSKDEGEAGDKETGVTPPLMSPDMMPPFPAPGGAGPVDPRQLLHLLARKVVFTHCTMCKPNPQTPLHC